VKPDFIWHVLSVKPKSTVCSQEAANEVQEKAGDQTISHGNSKLPNQPEFDYHLFLMLQPFAAEYSDKS